MQYLVLFCLVLHISTESTLTLPLGALKQGELGWVVHHGELVEERLNDFSHPCLGAYVQVLGSVFGEVERGPP